MTPHRFILLITTVLIALHSTVSHAANTIEFAATNYAGIEGAGVQLQLVIDQPVTTTNACVTVAQTGGSASSGDLYGFGYLFSGAILIPVSQSQVSVWVSLTDDGLPESDETVESTLTNPAGGLVLGPRKRAVVTIQNARPFFSLSWASGFEASGVEVHCARTGNTNVAFTVDYVTIANGSAVPGVNFVPTNGTIAVGAGVREVSFVLPALDDGVVNDPGAAKTFGFYLTNATAGVAIETTPTKLSIGDSQWPTTLDLNFQATGLIRPQSLAEHARGKLIVADDFAPEDASGPVTIVRMNEDGSLDSTFTAASVSPDGSWSTIDSILPQPDGNILIAGSFSSVNGVKRTNLARLNQNGTTDETFDAGSALLDGVRLSPIILKDDKILFVFAQSCCRNGSVRRLNSDGSPNGQFPVRLYSGGDWEDMPRISAMTIDNGRLLVGGYLATVNGIHRQGLARLLLDDAPQSAAVIAPGWPAFGDPGDGFEGMGEAKIIVRRLGDVRGAATVNYRTQDRSAYAGQDYTALAGALTFGPLEMEKSFRLPILNDTEFESDETVELVLSPGSGVAAVGTKTLFTIHDDEVTISGMQLHHDVNGVPSYVSLSFNSVPDQV